MNTQVTLYVKSKKTKGADLLVGREKTIATLNANARASDIGTLQYYDVERIPHYDYVLPQEQQEMVEYVKELGLRYGFRVEVVDLEKKDILSRYRLTHSNKIKTLPTMVTDSGETFEGVMTKEQIETFFSKKAKAK
jgi:hypothetical protein